MISQRGTGLQGCPVCSASCKPLGRLPDLPSLLFLTGTSQKASVPEGPRCAQGRVWEPWLLREGLVGREYGT